MKTYAKSIDGYTTTIVNGRFDAIDKPDVNAPESSQAEFKMAARAAFAVEIKKLLVAVQFLRDVDCLDAEYCEWILKPLNRGLANPDQIYTEEWA